VKEGAIDMVSIAADVPAETKKKIDEIKAGLKDGSFVIWKGPIVDRTGKEVLAKDAVADDKFLGGINFYVKGVEGKVPNVSCRRTTIWGATRNISFSNLVSRTNLRKRSPGSQERLSSLIFLTKGLVL
jgi:hypothetical protein